MRNLFGGLVLLSCAAGCIIEDEPHHGRETVYVEGHRHFVGCGHVEVHGHWYDRD